MTMESKMRKAANARPNRNTDGVPHLSESEERVLVPRAQQGDERAQERLLDAHKNLVGFIARRYADRGPSRGPHKGQNGYPALALDDMIQEGNIGLLEAIRKFNASKGTRLSTYAKHHIHHRIQRATANCANTIRRPVYVTKRLSRYRRTEAKLAHQLGRSPLPSELENTLGVTRQELEELDQLAQGCVSLEAPIIGKDGRTHPLSDFVPDENS